MTYDSNYAVRILDSSEILLAFTLRECWKTLETVVILT